MSGRKSSQCHACNAIMPPASQCARKRPPSNGRMGSSSSITGGASAANIVWWPALTGRGALITRRKKQRPITARTSPRTASPGTPGLFQQGHRAWWKNVRSVFTGSTKDLSKERKSGWRSSQPVSSPAHLMQEYSETWMTLRAWWQNSWHPAPLFGLGRNCIQNRRSFISPGEPS